MDSPPLSPLDPRTPEEHETARWWAPTTVAESPGRGIAATLVLVFGLAVIAASLALLLVRHLEPAPLGLHPEPVGVWMALLAGVAWVLTGVACLYRRWWLCLVTAVAALVIGVLAVSWS